MAATVTLPTGGSGAEVVRIRGRRTIMEIFSVDLDTSYPTGGYDISKVFNEFKLETSIIGSIAIFVQSRFGYVFDVDYANKKLLAYRQTAATSALVEVANAVNLSTVTGIKLIALGTPG